MASCSKRIRWQVLATLAGCLMALTHGITLGWFSPSLDLYLSDKSPFGARMTPNEATVAGSILGLGGILVNLILGWPLDFFGRKIIMYSIAIPNLINWLLVYFGGNVFSLYVARFLVGFSGGIMLVVLPIFVAEIADDNVRGTLSSLLILSLCAGITLGLIMATYISYYVLPFIIGSMAIVYMLCILPLPETPQFLLKRGRDEKAEKSFYFYKNLGSKSSNDPTKESEAKAEFNTFRETVLAGGNEKAKCRDYFTKEALKAFGLIIVVMLGNTFSGAFAILNYASKIFADLGSKMHPNTSGNIIGVFQLMGITCAVLLVDRVGRRCLVISSLVGTGLGELAVALVKSFASKKFLSDTGWLGLSLICFVQFIVSLGIVSLSFVLVVELLPVKILSVATSISIAGYCVLLFMVLLIYPWLIFNYGVASALYMSAGFCFFGAVILGIFLPETKGKQMLQ